MLVSKYIHQVKELVRAVLTLILGGSSQAPVKECADGPHQG